MNERKNEWVDGRLEGWKRCRRALWPLSFQGQKAGKELRQTVCPINKVDGD